MDAEIKNSKKLTSDLELAKEGFRRHPVRWRSQFLSANQRAPKIPHFLGFLILIIFLKSVWKNDCDSQREARRLAQERHLTIEDELDLEKIYLKSTIEDQKTKMFYLESRAQNYDYIAKQAKDSFWFLW